MKEQTNLNYIQKEKNLKKDVYFNKRKIETTKLNKKLKKQRRGGKYTRITKDRLKLRPVKGILNLKFSRNNTVGSLSDLEGKVKYKISAGLLDFKNSKKSTFYASESVVKQLASKALELGYDTIFLHLTGNGRGKNKCLDLINKKRLKVLSISDFTSSPHNGCRPPKIRRL